jgi:uncharacterized protein (DUF488 family)
MDLYTIGHSNHPLPRFLKLLRQHGIELLVDVRSVPRSRRFPQFNREALEKSLAKAGIEYEFLGRELGARADDPLLYENGRVSWARLAATGLFQSGLHRLRAFARVKRAAILCAEKEPLDCHRTLLVARELARRDGGACRISHILADGKLEAHRDCMLRLVGMTKVEGGDLFRTEEDRIDEACARREEKIAFRRERNL